MATTAATLSAERWLDEVMIKCTAPSDVLGAPMSESFTLPAGLGDVAVMSIMCVATQVDSLPVAPVIPLAVEAAIGSAGGVVVDLVGVGPWYVTGDTATANRLTCHIDPDALALWRQGEVLAFVSPEVDDDATPTGDFIAYVKAVRVRPLEVPASPVQLVR